MASSDMAGLVDVMTPVEHEGTQAVVRAWLKAAGESVRKDEPLVELETDKATVEIVASAAGVLVEQGFAIGAPVPPGSVLARLRPASSPAWTAASPVADFDAALRLSPSVRRLLRDSGLDPAGLLGTGRGGRLTREDVAAEIERQGSTAAPLAERIVAGATRRIPHDGMRRRIAEHMSRSLAVAPHVTAVFEADFTAVRAHRSANKAAFERQGVSLTYTAYLVLACVRAMAAVPVVNSRWHEDHLEVFGEVHVGIGTALGDHGLVVPVIRSAQSLSLLGIAQRLQDLTGRARAGRLVPADMQGGTFTISNHGVSGSLVAAPVIINQPQSAILGVGKLEKRVVVREVDGLDAIQIRPMAFVSLTIDHRAIDGSQTNRWLTRFVEALETMPPV